MWFMCHVVLGVHISTTSYTEEAIIIGLTFSSFARKVHGMRFVRMCWHKGQGAIQCILQGTGRQVLASRRQCQTPTPWKATPWMSPKRPASNRQSLLQHGLHLWRAAAETWWCTLVPLRAVPRNASFLPVYHSLSFICFGGFLYL